MDVCQNGPSEIFFGVSSPMRPIKNVSDRGILEMVDNVGLSSVSGLCTLQYFQLPLQMPLLHFIFSDYRIALLGINEAKEPFP